MTQANEIYNPCNTTSIGWTDMCTTNATWLMDYTTIAPEEDWGIEAIVSTVVPVFFGFIGLAGLIGNALVVAVVAWNPGMRSTTNLLIINLAVADLLFVVFCVPFTATDYVLTRWPFGDVWCKVVQYLIVVTAHASIYTLVLMSLDRYLAVVHPVASMGIRTESNAFIAIALAWMLIVSSALPVAICHGEQHYDHKGRTQSSCVFLESSLCYRPFFQVSFFLSSYAVPLLLICVLYVRLLARLWRNAPGQRLSAESRKGKRRVTRMVLVVVAAFAVCWLPIHVILVLKSLGKYEITQATVAAQIAAHVLAYTSSCVNPLLYAFLSEHFRRAFRRACCGPPPPALNSRGAPSKVTRFTGNANGTCTDVV
ncbi:allatostatin-A receptor-like [Arctopsyche grandis]|uniref:allatostatin-A receptor-like n=1 Tax=Arctopsyche grandis TaxID=121162 RepID=UPI00406DA027